MGERAEDLPGSEQRLELARDIHELRSFTREEYAALFPGVKKRILEKDLAAALASGRLSRRTDERGERLEFPGA